MNVIVNSLLVNYDRRGTGRTVLLLHGWGDSLATFKTLAARLATSYDIICVDLPGFGQSQQPLESWGLNEYSLFVRDFLKKLDVNELYALIGHSNGGAIAIKCIAGGTIKADKLVLLASAGVRADLGVKKRALSLVAKTGKATTSLLPSSARNKIRSRFYGAIGSDYLVVPGMQDTFRKVVGEDMQADASLLDISTLLIYGEADTATPVSHGEILQRAIAGSQLRTIAAVGHFIHQDDTGEVFSLVEEFLL